MKRFEALNNLIIERCALFGNIAQSSHHCHQIDTAQKQVDYKIQYQTNIAQTTQIDWLLDSVIIILNFNTLTGNISQSLPHTNCFGTVLLIISEN